MSSSAPSDSATPVQPGYESAQIANVIAAVQELKHPAQIGPYVVDALIGEGGMGLVYKAHQNEPIQRTVAIKVIKLGMDTREVIARFESERQALALMDHPNVARVLDAGATDAGRPYFVMEYVEGQAITNFADRQKLTVRQRLELFTQACDAVQHAHQKAIIHRDLKPSNILVTTAAGRPQVKVIDFGVAKAISQRLTEKTFFTATGQLLGTPEYMAPEQADRTAGALDADTRSDVYSLGVVLYELLTGAVPFDTRSLRSAGYNEIQRIIREVDPPRPSTKLSSLGEGAPEVARLRQMSLESLERQLKGELEWIPLKAMRKDRDQRYSSCTELSEDVANYLANRPLRAGPESVWYRVRKFLRRNEAGVVASAIMLLILIIGIITTTWQAVRATHAEARSRNDQAQAVQQQHEAERQRTEAEDARAAAQQVNTFLINLLESVDPAQALGKPVLVRDVLDKAAAAVATDFGGRPRVEAAVRKAIGNTFLNLGLYKEAAPQVDASIEINRRVGGADDAEALVGEQMRAIILRRLSKWNEALALYQDLLPRTRRVFGENHRQSLEVLNGVAVMLDLLGRRAEAEAVNRDAIERYRTTYGADDDETIRQVGRLASALSLMGRHAEALPLLVDSYDRTRRRHGDDYPETINRQTDLAYEYRLLYRHAEAEPMMRDAFTRSRKVLGEGHAHTILTEQGLAMILLDQGKNDEALATFRSAVERSRKTFGDDHTSTLAIMNATAGALSKTGHDAEAEPMFRLVIAGLSRKVSPNHLQMVNANWSLAITLQRLNRWDDALPLAKDVYDRLVQPGQVQLEPARRAKYMAAYGLTLSHLGRHADAVEPLTKARASLVDTGGQVTDTFRDVLSALVTSATALNRTDDAARWSAELAAAKAAAATRPATAPAGATTAPAAK